MNDRLLSLVSALNENGSLSVEEYEYLIENRTPDLSERLHRLALEKRRSVYGDEVYIRGLIEISNICKNDCFYCGIRKSNKECQRYRLSPSDILNCADEGYSLGFRTFVLQGGEDLYFTDEVLGEVVSEIKRRYPDCAVTLSLGERCDGSYKYLKDAGADRYLLRHESAVKSHYEMLHPKEMSYENRMRCLETLRALGYQVGCGFMVGSPYQTANILAHELKFVETFRPDMCGIGPFIPHCATPFKNMSAGTLEMTCFLLSVIRLIHPRVLLPATTALGTVAPDGREKGLLSGANVVMPNLSPTSVRKKYELYDNKICTGEESAQCVECLRRRVESVGFKVVTSRGDVKK